LKQLEWSPWSWSANLIANFRVRFYWPERLVYSCPTVEIKRPVDSVVSVEISFPANRQSAILAGRSTRLEEAVHDEKKMKIAEKFRYQASWQPRKGAGRTRGVVVSSCRSQIPLLVGPKLGLVAAAHWRRKVVTYHGGPYQWKPFVITVVCRLWTPGSNAWALSPTMTIRKTGIFQVSLCQFQAATGLVCQHSAILPPHPPHKTLGPLKIYLAPDTLELQSTHVITLNRFNQSMA
jgi:hypothetical protein